ncbi:MAG TPA: hypothetical protein VFD01_02825 [Candidatus Dormibacteraeota bacterium]|nr:hypothetical protein [Candidatus Dormibacteraeota bacterium]
MIRRQVVAIALTVVVAAVIGLLYLEAIAQSRATRPAWMLTRDVSTGALLEAEDVKQIRIPDTGDRFVVLQRSPLHRRAAHDMRAGTLLTPDDLLDRDLAQIPLTVRAAPDLSVGDRLDVYAAVGGRTVLVGRHLVVVAAGRPLSVLVPTADEPDWISLQANDVPLFAAKSDGAGVPDEGGVVVDDAVEELADAARGAVAGATPAAAPPPPAAASPGAGGPAGR